MGFLSVALTATSADQQCPAGRGWPVRAASRETSPIAGTPRRRCPAYRPGRGSGPTRARQRGAGSRSGAMRTPKSQGVQYRQHPLSGRRQGDIGCGSHDGLPGPGRDHVDAGGREVRIGGHDRPCTGFVGGEHEQGAGVVVPRTRGVQDSRGRTEPATSGGGRAARRGGPDRR